jgi:hypothetical protein
VTAQAGERSARVRLLGVSEERGGAGGARRSLPAASVELSKPGRRLVLFDATSALARPRPGSGGRCDAAPW